MERLEETHKGLVSYLGEVDKRLNELEKAPFRERERIRELMPQYQATRKAVVDLIHAEEKEIYGNQPLKETDLTWHVVRNLSSNNVHTVAELIGMTEEELRPCLGRSYAVQLKTIRDRLQKMGLSLKGEEKPPNSNQPNVSTAEIKIYINERISQIGSMPYKEVNGDTEKLFDAYQNAKSALNSLILVESRADKISIEDLGFSARVSNILSGKRIKTVAQLVQYTYQELLGIPSFNRHRLKEVLERLNELGLSLKE